MINFDSLTLKLFEKENKEFFMGAKIQKIQQPGRSELIFFVRNFAETKKLYINFNPGFYHLCFMSEENEKKRNIVIPKTAPMFCMLLRKYILNAKIVNVCVPKNERILELYFDYYDEMNEKSCLCLAVELMGKYSNVILYNYDTNVIIGCAHNVSSEKSRERELYGSMPYVYPPKQNKKSLLKVSFDSFYNSLDFDNIVNSVSSKYNYLTIPVVKKIYDSLKDFSYEQFYLALKNYLACDRYVYNISEDFSVYFLFKLQNAVSFDNINDLIDSYFSFHQNKVITENLKSKIIKYINTKLKKLNLLKEKQQEQINKLNKAIEYKTKGDILMANSYNLKDFSGEETLFDFEGNKILIQLDTSKTLIENANRYYSLYKKTKASFEHANLRIAETKSQIMFLSEQLFYAENSENIYDLEDIYEEVNEDIKLQSDKKIAVDYIDYSGYRIFIGKNKKHNDYILSKISAPDDLWFHPLNAPGSHVLIKRNDKNDIPDDVLLKAAEITKEYSSQKYNSKTSVIYTKRKYVKKATNKIAFVTYKNEVEIIV